MVVFISAGFIISRNLNLYKPKSDQEAVSHEVNKKKSQNQLMVCLVTLTVVMIIQNIYNFLDYYDPMTS